MPRHDGSHGVYHSKRQKGTSNRSRSGRGTYSKKGKGKRAVRLDRPYLEGTYKLKESV